VAETTSWLDYALISIVLLSALISLIRGFIREAFSLMTWIAAFWIAINFNEELAGYLKTSITHPEVRVAASFGILFVATLLVGGIINFVLGSLMQKAGLSGTDRMLGVLFGLGRGILLASLILLLASFTPLPQQIWWKQSQLLSYFEPLEQWMAQFVPRFEAAKGNEFVLAAHKADDIQVEKAVESQQD
jgi:membrane protein required for colicin V production